MKIPEVMLMADAWTMDHMVDHASCMDDGWSMVRI